MPTFAGYDIANCVLDVPSKGLWTATFEIAEEKTLVGQGALSLIPNQSWTATVLAGEPYAGRTKLWVVGGKGKLATTLAPKAYLGTTLLSVLSDGLSEAGETLDDQSGALSSHVVARWVRARMTAASLLEFAAGVVGTSWRASTDGKIIVGAIESSTPTWKYDLTAKDMSVARIEIASEDGLAVPGNVIEGITVARAQHKIDGSSIRSTLWGAL